ncbi:MAG: hypothetical protein OEQ39_10090, partial [Gammaproteobacteria bacterium]|nr:hypothetical protein [Gammaproteobacteria bacterium]
EIITPVKDYRLSTFWQEAKTSPTSQPAFVPVSCIRYTVRRSRFGSQRQLRYAFFVSSCEGARRPQHLRLSLAAFGVHGL